MIGVGTVVADDRGRSYRVLGELATGGQGTAFKVERVDTRKHMVLKVLDANFATPETAQRLDALIRLDLSARSPALCGPIARMHPRWGLGTIQPLAAGVPLEEVFAKGCFSLLDGLGMGIAVAKAIAVLEREGVAHGDIAATNVLVVDKGAYYEAVLIDFDNTALPGAPAPPLAGQVRYCAPEVLLGHKKPSVVSDRFALAILLHVLLLRQHPFEVEIGAGLDLKAYIALASEGRWPDDPAAGWARPGGLGLPVGALSRDLQALFRAALDRDPRKRPAAETWVHALTHGLEHLYACDGCDGVCINEPTRYLCPYCQRPASRLDLVIGPKVIDLGALVTVVGRGDVGGMPMVSRKHAAFRRDGFALRVECLSRNGLAVWRDGAWSELKAGEATRVTEGDRVKLTPGVEGVFQPHPA